MFVSRYCFPALLLRFVHKQVDAFSGLQLKLVETMLSLINAPAPGNGRGPPPTEFESERYNTDRVDGNASFMLSAQSTTVRHALDDLFHKYTGHKKVGHARSFAPIKCVSIWAADGL